MLKGAQAAFAVAYFWGLTDVHEYLDGVQMIPSPLDKETAGDNSPCDWLMSLAIN